MLYKISDLVPDAEEFIGKTIYLSDGSSVEVSEAAIDSVNGAYIVPGPLYCFMQLEVEGLSIPSTGLYVLVAEGSATHFTRVELSKVELHQLDEKFIPDTIARKSDIPVASVNGMTGDVMIDWRHIPMLPITEGDTITIEWDGDTTDRSQPKSDIDTLIYYWIAPLPGCDLTLLSGTRVVSGTSSPISVGPMEYYPGAIYGNSILIVENEQFMLTNDAGILYTAPKGIYFAKAGNIYISSATFQTHPFNEGMIPSTIAHSATSHGLAVPDAAGETVTAAEFNALLASLRSAGYLATE